MHNGIIQEPPPGEDDVVEPYLSETQRAYQRNRSTLDCLLVNSLTALRARACRFILLRNGTLHAPPANVRIHEPKGLFPFAHCQLPEAGMLQAELAKHDAFMRIIDMTASGDIDTKVVSNNREL